jgi:oligopeptidase B
MLLNQEIALSQAPKAEPRPKTIELHGDRRVDNYFWLRDRTDPKVIEYLEAENRYTAAQMKPSAGLQERLYTEILSHIKEDDVSAPIRRGDYLYYTRIKKGEQYRVWCRRKASGGAEEVLLDGNELAKGHDYFLMGAVEVSPNQKLLAFGTDTSGDEVFTLRVKDLETGKLLEDRIENTYYGLVWAQDNKTLFYNVLDEAKRPYKALRHTLGAKKDVEVYHEPDERYTVDLEDTRSRSYILLSINSQITSEVRYLRADQPEGNFQVLYPRTQNVEYQVTHHGDNFYVRINDTGRTFRLIEAPVSDPSRKKEILPARPEVTLEAVDAFGNYLVVVERNGGLRKLLVEDFATGKARRVPMPEEDYSLEYVGEGDYATTQLRFEYSSLVTPPTDYDFDMEKWTLTAVKRQEVPGHVSSNYAAERIFAAAADGTRVPISLVYRKGLQKDGANPCLLYGYGAYGIPTESAFKPDIISLLDRGFIYAIAHIRGGGDLGKQWHDDGKMMQKRNTFSDFIAAAELLVKDKYTQPKLLAIMGGSAGGLLMGAVTNMRPDLFGAVVAKVPFVDVLSTMMDSTLPLTVGEYEEWGNPADQASYSYMRSYSPYDNMERQNYPSMLVTGGLNDPRVSYWEPAKYVAKLRTLNKGTGVILLKMNLGTGHFGPSGRYERYRETAFDYAFMMQALGLKVN